jgi:hypothetical protein
VIDGSTGEELLPLLLLLPLPLLLLLLLPLLLVLRAATLSITEFMQENP